LIQGYPTFKLATIFGVSGRDERLQIAPRSSVGYALNPANIPPKDPHVPTNSDQDQFPTPVAGRQLLHCDLCGRSMEPVHADLVKYIMHGWPICCGEVMTYYREAKRPHLSDDTESIVDGN
jgi:hypothetical protein